MNTVSQTELDFRAEMLMLKTSHYLITMMGQTTDEANSDEIYRALCYALREEIMINWLATAKTLSQHNSRTLYYLSMEYLPGRLFSNNILNICAMDVVKLALQKLNRSYLDIAQREDDPGLGNGGLGRLASCFLDSLVTHHYPTRGYGLRYQYGTFEQQLWEGVQVEIPDCWLIHENPWEFRRDLRKVNVRFCGMTHQETNIHGDPIESLTEAEEVYALPYDFPVIGYSTDESFSVGTLRLWTTNESPRNFQIQRYHAGHLDQAAENTTLTDVLYPSDYHDVGKRIRLKQEFLLVSASLQDIIRHYLDSHDNFRQFADKVRIQINDTHPAVAIAELMRLLTKRHDLPWKRAYEITEAVMGYTNHTVMSEALEVWDANLFKYLLPRQYKVIERLNLELCTKVRQTFPGDENRVRRMSIIEDGRLHMANLAIAGSHKVNGVAELHTEILKSSVFKDFYELWPEKFLNVTNGVTQRRWLTLCSPELSHWITQRIGPDWVTDFTKIADLAKFASDPESQKQFLEIKLKNKEAFSDFIERQEMIRNAQGVPSYEQPILLPNSLFDVQIKRIHEYKRQLMNILHVIMLYHDILQNDAHDRIQRTVIIGGKAAASYTMAKHIILLAHAVARKIRETPKVAKVLQLYFMENYNVSHAEVIIPAADLSEQISTAGMEASGTGNMKLAINGALTIGTEDGANIEMRKYVTDEWWPFKIGHSAKEIDEMRKSGSYRSWEVCAQNEKIKRALDSVRDETFAKTELEKVAFREIYRALINGEFGRMADPFFVLADLEDFYNAQKRVEALYREPNKWAEFAIHNMAGMHYFSADRSVQTYAKEVWELTSVPLDPSILSRVREEYSKRDRCRIF